MPHLGNPNVQLTALDRVPTPGGDVLHGIKASEMTYAGFGEAYFSFIDSGAIKGWKKHLRMTLNLVVPVGLVRFVIYDENDKSFCEIVAGESNYVRLTVNPGMWLGFQGIAPGRSLILNVADLEHDFGEIERKSLLEINFDWGRS